MKQTTIKKALKVINRALKLYQGKLTFWLELKAETELCNGNINVRKPSECSNYIQKYETIISNLATIKRAIRDGKEEVKIYCSAEASSFIPNEIHDVIEESGFEVDGDPDGTIFLIPTEELEEEMAAAFASDSFLEEEAKYMAAQLDVSMDIMFDD